MDLSKQIETEQRRLQERSQIAHLQGQVDELRHRLEQQAAKTQLANDQARQTQELITQLQARFEAQIGESRLQEQNRQRAFQSLKKEIAEVRVRVEEPARQLLTLMAQSQDLQEGLRLLRQEIEQGQDEQKEAAQRLEETRAQGLLLEERVARIDTLLGRQLEGEEARDQTIRQVRTEVEAERQNLRRQAADVERLAADLRGESQELLSRVNRLADLQRQGSAAMEALGENLGEARLQIDRLVAELQRVERQSVEQALKAQERIEDLRQSMQRDYGAFREAEERRGESQTSWLRRIEDLYQGMEERMARRDEELGTQLTRLEERMNTLDRDGDRIMRGLLQIFQDQLEHAAEERLRQAGPAEEEE
jgi:DNA repair exonuclease SbcCD ATPase subunit